MNNINAAEEETITDRDDVGRSYSSIAREAMQAIGAMCETSRELMAYYEKDIRTTKMEDLNGAMHARFVSSEAKFLNPQLSLECSREIPANKYFGTRTIYHSELIAAQKFLLGVCREHYNDHGVEVYVTEAPKTAAETLWNPGAFINVAIVNTSIIMKPMLVVVTNARKKIFRGNVTQSRVSAMPFRLDKPMRKPEQLSAHGSNTIKTPSPALVPAPVPVPAPAPVTAPAPAPAPISNPTSFNATMKNDTSIVTAIASVFSPKISIRATEPAMIIPLKVNQNEDSPNVIIVNTTPENTVVNGGGSRSLSENDQEKEKEKNKKNSNSHDHVYDHDHDHDHDNNNDHERKRLLPPVTPSKTNEDDNDK